MTWLSHLTPAQWAVVIIFLLTLLIVGAVILHAVRRDDRRAAAAGCNCHRCRGIRERWGTQQVIE